MEQLLSMNVLDLFSGIGGFSLGLERAGMKTVAFCEIDLVCQEVLRKHWPDIPIFSDIRNLDESNIKQPIDIVCGGFPCQDVSHCGNQEGLSFGTRSGLWAEEYRIIRIFKPKAAIIENVTGLLTGDGGGWFGTVLCDLAQIGFSAQWHCIPASAVGACHNRERVWIVAYPNGSSLENMDISQSILSYPKESCRRQFARAIDAAIPADAYVKMRGDFNDVSGEMERIKQYGNTVVPQIPEIIGRAIMQLEYCQAI
ncbi:MAG: DNA (cytosine-5-)-methyltransferase [Desulforhopalus sp.]